MEDERMLLIGFDEEEEKNIREIFDETEEEPKPQGQLFSKVERKPVYISPERLKVIEAGMNCVVVHDFGDEYHLSEEERQAKNHFYETFKILRKAKNNYRHIDEYVTVMREALHCLDVVAENNGVYTPDEFKKLFMRNKIYINGLKFPKYKGKNRKDISWEYLSEFILSDEDPKKLLHQETDIFTDDELIDDIPQMFNESELDSTVDEYINADTSKDTMYYDPDDENDDTERSVAVSLTSKESKLVLKYCPEIFKTIKRIKRNQSSTKHLSSFAFELTADDINHIEEYDRKHNYKSSSDIPEFIGSILDDDNYNRFMMELDEYADENIREDYHGRLKTLGAIKELEIKEVLEDSGWNIKAFSDNKEREKKLRKAQKRDKEREKKLKNQLLKVQKRQKRRMGDDVVSKKKKKKNKVKDDGDD